MRTTRAVAATAMSTAESTAVATAESTAVSTATATAGTTAADAEPDGGSRPDAGTVPAPHTGRPV
jgi:hypothetical protein